MDVLVVVNNPEDWPLKPAKVQVMAARDYLTNPGLVERKSLRVFNLCRSYRYQSTGYYVSLLAEARGHRPFPDLTTIQDLKSSAMLRIHSEELDEDIQRAFAGLRSPEQILSIYFGRNLARKYDRLCQQLFKSFQAPFLRAHFTWHEGEERWQLQGIRPIAASEIPADHLPFVRERAAEFFAGHQRVSRPRHRWRYDLAILYNEEATQKPSNARAIRHFVRAAESLDLATELLGREDSARLAEFDGLFIRDTTNVHHYTYRWARRAAAQGLVVVDDPVSILKCSNKVFLAELLQKHRVPIPRTVTCYKEISPELLRELGLPCILKQPDSSFSQGVVKVESREELLAEGARMFAKSDLLIAQAFLPTTFDWRVGVFDRQPIYVCRYHMADKHWQIVHRDETGDTTYGRVDSIPVEHAPTPLLKIALKAANLIGDGLYGLDIKQIGDQFVVIEINDNPNIDAGYEDEILKDELYLRIMRVFLRRIEHSKTGGYVA
ncbi:MAG: RimK family protein [bacterium]|jgi:glutathione synthase/RimK-type ligase-like ATP-grasp enzyme|nr:RimK family protein [bacterium]